MLRDLIVAHPTRTLLPASFILSFLSLSLTPSFVSLVFLLTSLLLYTRATSKQSYPNLRGILLWLNLTVSISCSHLAPSIDALSTVSTSILSLILLSGISSLIALVPIYSRHYIKQGPHVQIFVFPTLWTTIWLLASWASPLGRLVTWSPLSGVESYAWIRTLFGFAGIDWITAAWASVAAETLGSIVFGAPEHERPLVDLENDPEARKPSPKSPKHLTSMTGLLLALTIPSFVLSPLPLAPFSLKTTPLRVACILPAESEKSQLERFLYETRQYSSAAKILLWPESAVVFETESDKIHALEKVQEITNMSHNWIGVSFEERVAGAAREGQRRNGMALVGRDGVEMVYYKRRLVPIAESFSQLASNEAPPIHTIELPPPPHTPKHDWDPSGTRAIPLSASICLDFSTPLTSLSSRPALVLAPARTWNVGVGHAMYELARARAEEIGADVLWCDGGAGGLSGVAGNIQVGKSTWVATIGVPYPANAAAQRRTLYGVCGDWLALVLVLSIPGLIWAMERNLDVDSIQQGGESAIGWTRERFGHAIARVRGVVHRRAIAPPSVSLIDDT